MTLEFSTYTRRPFPIEAVEVTEENIEEIAPFVGAISRDDEGVPSIVVDSRLVPNVSRVYLGYFFTRMESHRGGHPNVRCYNPKTFHEQFVLGVEELADRVHNSAD